MDTVHHLVKMANDIAAFFESNPDSAKGAQETAEHLRKFWEPRMRRQIFQHLDSANGAGLKELALMALRTHRDQLDPAKYAPSAK